MSASSTENDDSPDEQGQRKRIHLLLHCKDGCVPFLNPTQLERYFPPSCGLWLGLAVEDSCVTPVFDKPGKKKTKDDAITTNVKDDATPKKVRGYTFAPQSLDPWLLPYTRLAVPSFYNDNNNDNHHDPQRQHHQHKVVYSTSKNSNGNKAIFVWTPHGRQKLASETYIHVARRGLQSQHTLSLCDHPDHAEHQDAVRWDKANARNNAWLQELLLDQASAKHQPEENGDGTSTPTLVWKPILLSSPAASDMSHQLQDTNSRDDGNGDNIKTDSMVSLVHNNQVHGVAFVGQWQPNALQTVFPTLSKQVQWKCVLSTKSLLEMVEIAAEGYINVIGTYLPAQWAKNKLALAIILTSHISNGDDQRATKRLKTITKGSNAGPSCLDANGCMDMSDKCFASDSSPLVEGCTCLACQNGGRFSRAYIHHLVCAKEMLAEILLFGHNLHHLMKVIDLFNNNGEKDPTEILNGIKSQLAKAACAP